MKLKKITLIGAGVVLLGIAGVQKAISLPATGTEVTPVRASDANFRAEYECEFHDSDISCEAEGRIHFRDVTRGERIWASLDLTCVSKKDHFRIRDRSADADKEGDDLEIAAKGNGRHARLVLKEFFDEFTVMNEDLDAKLFLNGRTLHGFCDIDKEHGNGGSDGGDNANSGDLLVGGGDGDNGGPANSGQNADD